MTYFTLIAYKPNGSIYSFGECEQSWDSDLIIYRTDSEDSLIRKWGEILFSNIRTLYDRECKYGVTIFDDGEKILNSVENVRLLEMAGYVCIDLQRLADIEETKIQAARLTRENEELVQKRLVKERNELNEYKRLKAMFEPSPQQESK